MGNMGEGGSVYRELGEIFEGVLWKRACLSKGASLGKLEWAHLPGTFIDG